MVVVVVVVLIVAVVVIATVVVALVAIVLVSLLASLTVIGRSSSRRRLLAHLVTFDVFLELVPVAG